MKLWSTESDGTIDVLETAAIYAVAVVLFKFLTSDMALGPVIFSGIDGGTIAAILTPTLGSLVAKKHSDNLTKSKGNDNASQS